jgi:hypothetical protein
MSCGTVRILPDDALATPARVGLFRNFHRNMAFKAVTTLFSNQQLFFNSKGEIPT